MAHSRVPSPLPSTRSPSQLLAGHRGGHLGSSPTAVLASCVSAAVAVTGALCGPHGRGHVYTEHTLLYFLKLWLVTG